MSFFSRVPEIDVESLAKMRAEDVPHLILDVREPHEVALCVIEGSLTIPMGEIPNRLDELPRDMPIVVVCHHGGRSARVTQFLLAQGFDQAVNLKGGIDAWAQTIEPEMARY